VDLYHTNAGIPSWKCADCGFVNPPGSPWCGRDYQMYVKGLDQPVASGAGLWVGLAVALALLLFALKLAGQF